MSANITIKEDGQGKVLNAIKKLKISTGNETSLWLPENDIVLDDKSITKNGTYKASDDGLYGYSEVTVNVTKKSSTSGKKPDGNDYNVERDQDGNIVETKLPSSIRLTTNPTKMSYENGESIDMTGAVIKAYCGDGTLWEGDGYSGGTIPLSELTLDPTTAIGEGGGTYNQYPSVTKIVYYKPSSTKHYIWAVTEGDARIVLLVTGIGSVYVGCFARNGGKYNIKHTLIDIAPELEPTKSGSQWGIDSSNGFGGEVEVNGITVFDDDTSLENMYRYAYGDKLQQKITVKWNRPKDDEELTTSFDISVN